MSYASLFVYFSGPNFYILQNVFVSSWAEKYRTLTSAWKSASRLPAADDWGSKFTDFIKTNWNVLCNAALWSTAFKYDLMIWIFPVPSFPVWTWLAGSVFVCRVTENCSWDNICLLPGNHRCCSVEELYIMSTTNNQGIYWSLWFLLYSFAAI